MISRYVNNFYFREILDCFSIDNELLVLIINFLPWKMSDAIQIQRKNIV